MDRKYLDEMEEEADYIIKKFKNKELSPEEDFTPVYDFLLGNIDKEYTVRDINEFKKHNLATLERIHDALKDDEPEILAQYGIKPKKKKIEEDEECTEEPTI